MLPPSPTYGLAAISDDESDDLAIFDNLGGGVALPFANRFVILPPFPKRVAQASDLEHPRFPVDNQVATSLHCQRAKIQRDPVAQRDLVAVK